MQIGKPLFRSNVLRLVLEFRFLLEQAKHAPHIKRFAGTQFYMELWSAAFGKDVQPNVGICWKLPGLPLVNRLIAW